MRPKNIIKVNSGSIMATVQESQKMRARQDLLKLRSALDTAEITGARYLLHLIYDEIWQDPMFSSQWESRKMKTKSRDFKITDESGDEDEDLTELFNASWFVDFMDVVLDAKAWGFSLIEFGPWQNGQFMDYLVSGKRYKGINVISRDHVRPEVQGITKDVFSDPVIFMGEKTLNAVLVYGDDNFGLMLGLAKYILFKNNCLANWSEWAEIFGMDRRVGYTDAQDTPGSPARSNFLRAMRDLGSNAYGIFTTRDKIEYLGTNRTDAFGVYRELIAYIDEQVAKKVFGQDVVSNNTGRVVGTVGENVSNMYGDSDARWLKGIVNGMLFPFMAEKGVPLEGKRFVWDTSEKMSMSERADIDLKIAQMGVKPSSDYVEKTYGIEANDNIDPANSYPNG